MDKQSPRGGVPTNTEDDETRHSRPGKRVVKMKNQPSVVNVFGSVDETYHNTGLSDPPLVGQRPVREPGAPKPAWLRAENPAPVKIQHPNQGDLKHDRTPALSGPTTDTVTQLLLAKVSALEAKLETQDYGIMQQEWEINNLKQLRNNAKATKRGLKVRNDVEIARQPVLWDGRGKYGHKPMNKLLSEKQLPIRQALPDIPAVAMSADPDAAPMKNSLLINARPGMRSGKRMYHPPSTVGVHAPFSTDPSTKYPKKKLSATSVPSPSVNLHRFAQTSKDKFNSEVFTDSKRVEPFDKRRGGATPMLGKPSSQGDGPVAAPEGE